MTDFDLMVIGSGPGGHAVAERSARLGGKVALIEKNLLGGTCTNMGCIPTKALLICSEHYAELPKLSALGVDVTAASFDFAQMKAHQALVVARAREIHHHSLQEKGVTLIDGEGHIEKPGQVMVRDREGQEKRYTTQNIVIAWGSTPLSIPGIPFDDNIISSDGILSLETLPPKMAIVGGGVIGVEFATFLSELDVKVTLINLSDRLLGNEEEESSALIQQSLERRGVKVICHARVEGVEEVAHGIKIILKRGPEADDDLTVIEADKLLVSIGRRPVLYEEELNALGIEYSERGVVVDASQQTSVTGIYALGDVTGGMQLAHRASHQGKALASKLFGNGSVEYNEKAVAGVTYTHPPVARVGVTEREARESGLTLDIRRADYRDNPMALAELSEEGFVKLIFEKDGPMLGATIVGQKSFELIPSLSLAIAHKFGRREFKHWIIPHPTLSEVLGEAIF